MVHIYEILTLTWIVAFILFLVLEAVTVGLFSIWFATGSLAAFAVSFPCHNLALRTAVFVQIFTFMVVTLVALFFVRPIVQDKFTPKLVKTNTQALIGKEAVVTEVIDNRKEQGKVKVNGMDWTARSIVSNVAIQENDIVTVKEISGVKLIVEKKEKEQK